MLFMAPLTALMADIKFSHTIFAMPFALLGAFMAATFAGEIGWDQFALQLMLIVICMFFARTVAMLANRILDKDIDAINPRTKHRALPSGAATVFLARIVWLFNAWLFIGATSCFGFLWDNWVPFFLAAPVLGWLSIYPLFKRFTWLSHLYLGSSLAISPIAAVIAVQPEVLEHPSIWLLSGAVLCWVAGFDIIYALQDVESDVRDNLKSMPASLGIRPAMLISQLLHCFCVAFLFGVASTQPELDWLFLTAVFFVAGVLVIEHATVKQWGTTKIALTFFTLNGVVSCVLGASGIADLLSSQ